MSWVGKWVVVKGRGGGFNRVQCVKVLRETVKTVITEESPGTNYPNPGAWHKNEIIQEVPEGKVDAIRNHAMEFSDGLHIYEQYFGLVNCLNIKKIQYPH